MKKVIAILGVFFFASCSWFGGGDNVENKDASVPSDQQASQETWEKELDIPMHEQSTKEEQEFAKELEGMLDEFYNDINE